MFVLLKKKRVTRSPRLHGRETTTQLNNYRQESGILIANASELNAQLIYRSIYKNVLALQ